MKIRLLREVKHLGLATGDIVEALVARDGSKAWIHDGESNALGIFRDAFQILDDT